MPRLSIFAILPGILFAAPALADGFACQANILSGPGGYTDLQTKEPIRYVPLPVAPTTGVYASNVTFDLDTILPAFTRSVEPLYDVDTPFGEETATYVPPQEYVPPQGYVPPTPPVTPGPTMPSDILNETSWELTSLAAIPVTAKATLTFNPEGSGFGGRAQCNTYGGGYTAFTNFDVSFSNVFSTRLACPALAEENAYFDALRSASTFRLGREGDGLALLDEAGVQLATFRRAEAAAANTLVGVWNVAGVLIDGEMKTDSGFGSPTFRFTEAGRFEGQLGCNMASGGFSERSGALRFDRVAVTARQCFVPAPFEGPIITHLPRISRVAFSAGSASLMDASGTVLIRLAR